jgi:hypothetical protein
MPSTLRISRRCFLSGGAAAIVPLQLSGQTVLRKGDERDARGVPVKLLATFKNSQLLDISPDSKKRCLYFTSHPK